MIVSNTEFIPGRQVQSLDLRESAKAEPEAAALPLAAEQVRKPFDLTKDPLARIKPMTTSTDRHRRE